MGLGILGGGAGLAKFLAELGAKVTVTDLKTETQLAPSLEKLRGLPIRYVLGKHQKKDFLESDLIIRNPDVSLDNKFLKLAQKKNISVVMDESLFLKLCPVSVIGVTGTRGKTTTTILIGEILKKANFPVLLGGNLPGVATLSLLPQITPQTKVVLELSSWQLQGLAWEKVSPHTAVITNIYPDHLNRYKSMADYIADKKIIFKYQKRDDFLILNKENEIVESLAAEAPSKIFWFKKADWPQSWPLKIPGAHNRENAAAAMTVGRLLKIDDKVIKEAVGNFPGVPHRLEVIRKINGVTFVNDTTATMPEAAIAALRAYAGQPIILICGGNSKNLDLTNFAKEIVKRVKAVVLLEGTATDELEKAIKQYSNLAINDLILGRFNNLPQAVLVARKVTNSGDIVLLSPGCTSFGMFKNEFDRGEQFRQIVKSLLKRKNDEKTIYS